MDLKSIYLKFKGTLLPLVTLLSLFTIALALAQTPEKKMAGVITIDGAQAPDRIPDWILWQELFKTATLLSDKSLTKGNEFWAEKLHLPKNQVDPLIQHAQVFNSMKSATKIAVSNLRSSPKETKESLRIKLRQAQMNEEVQILELRDALRARIGEDAFQMLESYARINIAPTIKVGNMVRK